MYPQNGFGTALQYLTSDQIIHVNTLSKHILDEFGYSVQPISEKVDATTTTTITTTTANTTTTTITHKSNNCGGSFVVDDVQWTLVVNSLNDRGDTKSEVKFPITSTTSDSDSSTFMLNAPLDIRQTDVQFGRNFANIRKAFTENDTVPLALKPIN